MSQQEQVLTKMLHEKYGKLLLSKKECSQEIGRSCSSLDRDRQNSIGIQFLKQSDGNIYYPISEIASYLTRVKKTV
jgi:hypothetical protein